MRIENPSASFKTLENGEVVMNLQYDIIGNGETHTINIFHMSLDSIGEINLQKVHVAGGSENKTLIQFETRSPSVEMRLYSDENGDFYSVKEKIEELTLKEIQMKLEHAFKIIG